MHSLVADSFDPAALVQSVSMFFLLPTGHACLSSLMVQLLKLQLHQSHIQPVRYCFYQLGFEQQNSCPAQHWWSDTRYANTVHHSTWTHLGNLDERFNGLFWDDGGKLQPSTASVLMCKLLKLATGSYSPRRTARGSVRSAVQRFPVLYLLVGSETHRCAVNRD